MTGRLVGACSHSSPRAFPRPVAPQERFLDLARLHFLPISGQGAGEFHGHSFNGSTCLHNSIVYTGPKGGSHICTVRLRKILSKYLDLSGTGQESVEPWLEPGRGAR